MRALRRRSYRKYLLKENAKIMDMKVIMIMITTTMKMIIITMFMMKMMRKEARLACRRSRDGEDKQLLTPPPRSLFRQGYDGDEDEEQDKEEFTKNYLQAFFVRSMDED